MSERDYPKPIHRLPWRAPASPAAPEWSDAHAIALSTGDPWGHAVAICAAMSGREVESSHFDLRQRKFVDGPLAGMRLDDIGGPTPHLLPTVVHLPENRVVCDDPVAICHSLAPQLFEARDSDADVRPALLDAVYELGREPDQATYEQGHEALRERVEKLDVLLSERRFLGGPDPSFDDILLFTWSIRLDPVYYELFKASIGRLADFPRLEAHARDLFEQPAFYETTNFDAIKRDHYLVEPVTNPRQLVPRGGIPDLHAPHFRARKFADRTRDGATDEDQQADRLEGEFVRGHSRHRDWIRPDPDARYPAESARYHLYAPFNCPWSHRALLARAVKGLEPVVGASIVYFRRDPDRGWQFNPAIPGCTADLANGYDYIAELYERVGSDERSVPVLWDTETNTIVSNESAEILRMFNDAFGDLAEHDIDLYPEWYRDEIDRINEAVYQRINNGAYKAGFARTQGAYARAFDRYFRALDWLEDRLANVDWLAGTPQPTEADLRLYPTLFRHDTVYYARFKLNRAKVCDYPRLSEWLERIEALTGVTEASNLDHARNGYFGRTGNEVVPAGPVSLGLSPKDFARDVWLNR